MKSLWVRFVLLLFVAIGVLTWLYKNQQEREILELAKEQESIRVGYEASVMMYRLATKEAYDSTINTPSTLSMIQKGVNSSGRAQARARGELYRKLYPFYESLRVKNIRHLHFHLPDGKSYLRFHKPKHYGDDLFEAKPSVRVANETRGEVEGFEAGRVLSAYRYLYPLEFEGNFLGTVEMGIPVNSILNSLKALDSSREYAYIIDGKIAKDILFEEQFHLYTCSTINPDFYIEDALQELPDSPPPLSQRSKAINKKLANNSSFQKALASGQAVSLFVEAEGESYSVTLQPMKGVERGVEGFLIAYQKNPTPQILRRGFQIVAGLIFVWGVAILTLMYRNHQRNTQIVTHKEKLQTIIDTLIEGVYVMDERGIITEANATACALLGYKREEMIGCEAHGLFHAHTKDQSVVPLEECPIYEAFQEGSSYRSSDECFKHKNGSFIKVRVGANPLIESGKVTSMVIVFSDITQEKADEAHRQLLTQAVKSSTNAIVITDKDATIQWANPAFESLAGFKLGEAIGKKPRDLIYSGKQSPDFYAALWETILSGKPWQGEVINKRKDGTLYTEELNITPVLSDNREIAHFIAIKQDISNRKEYEKILKESKKKAELAAKAKSDFLANMSHEIRTPLNAIIGFNELLSQTPLNKRQEELLKKSADSSKLLLHILNDILDYSKIEAGELELHNEPTKLGEILAQIENIFKESATSKGIQFTISKAKSLPYLVKTDGLRLLQILANLVSNGIKFTHEGSVELRVTLLHQSVKNATLLFEVIDSGIGMSQEQIEKVFDVFTQADTSITRRYGGSGLGLSIAKHLATMLKGDLRIQSQEGEGTTVSFSLKAAVISWEGEDEEIADDEVLPNLEGNAVLIVEDNPINQEVEKRMCERVGLEVDVAGDGEEGVAIFAQNPERYSCILMDLQMPVMDGYEATKKIRNIDPLVPIIALTAAASTEDRQKVLAAGMNEHLGKPIDSKRLYMYLQKWCKIDAKSPAQINEISKSKPTVLIVDDDSSNIQRLSQILKDEYHIKVASSGKMALRVVETQAKIDAILLDIMMPDIDGYSLCKKLKEDPRMIHVPILFTTAKNSPEDEAYGFSLGATDYITKPYHPAVVQARVRHQIEFRQRQKELENLSMMDGLTKIPNRRYFDEHFETAFRDSVREGKVIALMILDIDYFKPYNDNYGHGQGDRVLIQVAKALQGALRRPWDKIFRYGGEEFAVVLSGTSEKGAHKMAEVLRQSVEELKIPHAYSKTSNVVTVSIGWILKTSSLDIGKATMFRYADEALYGAKSAGRNRVMQYNAKEHFDE